MTSITTESGTTGTINYQYYLTEHLDKSKSYAIYIAIDPYNDDDALLKKAQKKVTAVNRERQIEDILEDKPFEPLKIEDTDKYKEYMATCSYSTYIAENLNRSICYTEYIAEQLINK
jgi:hypothetical protein